MVHRLFRTSCLLPSVACLLVLAACSRRETPVDEGIRSQTLLIGNLAEPRDLDPQVVTAYTDMNILAAIFEGLTVLDEVTGAPLPGTADKWEISPDGLVYTFHLRPNARWSNGDKVTAQDFAYSFRRILTPAFASEYAYMLWPIKNGEAFYNGKITDPAQLGIATPDESTLVLTLERPTTYLLALAAHNTWYPVPRATIEKFGRMDQPGTAWTRAGNLVGNGPFTLTEWTTNARITVDKNPHYWDAASVRLNRIRFFPTESADVDERNFRAGQVHLTYDVPVSKIAGYRAQNPSPLRNDPLLGMYYLDFNVTKPPFNNPLVRRALGLAIDREAISRTVYEGVWPASFSFTPPQLRRLHRAGEDPGRLCGGAPPARRSRFPRRQGPAFDPDPGLNDVRQPKLAEALQAMWLRELGIHVTIESSEQKIWLQNQQSLSHQIGVMGWTADFPDPVTFLSLGMTGNGNNYTGWSDATFDGLMNRAADTADPAARFEIFQQAEARLLSEGSVSPLVNRSRTYLMNPAVKNWDPAIVGIHLYKKVYLQSP